jgi:glycine/D-amino acid oxidase-like deaminating enzyme
LQNPGVPSFWLSRPARPLEADYIVVGGGIFGLSTAYWLAKAGCRPLLLEAGSIASRASGRNAGFLITGTAESYVAAARLFGEETARWWWERSRDNRELLRSELLDSGRIDCELLTEGSWVASLAGTGQEEELKESCEALQPLGFDLEWKDADEIRRASGSDRFGGGLFQKRDCGLDPVRLCRGIAHEIIALGGEIRTGVRIRAIEPEGDRVRLTSDAGTWLAGRAVLALNSYVTQLLPELGGEVRPVRAQMLATAPGPRTLRGVWYVNDGYEYFRQLPDGTFLLGGCRWTARDSEVGYLEAPTGRVQAALESFLREALPQFAGRPIVQRWAGTMALTPDGLPRRGTVPGIPGALYVTGCNGHGMSTGFVTGRDLAGQARG